MARILLPNHPIAENIPWQRGPLFLGYNQTKARTGSTVIAEIGDSHDPMMVCWTYEQGKVFVLATDPVPHWGNGFAVWPYYRQFWQQVLTWLQ